MIRFMSVRVEVAVDVEPGTERVMGQYLATEASDAVLAAINAEKIGPSGAEGDYYNNPLHAATVVRR